MKILLIDDSTVFRGLMRRMLREAGYGRSEILDANGAEPGLQLIVTEHPDLVLCDVMMPGMTGDVLFRLSRKSCPDTDFGFVTTQGTERMKRELKESGAAFILPKPLAVEELRAALDDFVEKKRVA